MTTFIEATDSQSAMLLPIDWTLSDLQRHLGGVALDRIRLYPPPGMATEEDVLAIKNREDRLCELVDGVLVEKVMASYESLLAGIMIHFIHGYLDQNPLGVVLAPDGLLWILPHRMRIPDVSFIRWERFPDGRLPADRVFRVAPNLAVEILSAGNTSEEMNQKLDDYFAAGVQLVWYIDPQRRGATVYTAADQSAELGIDDCLDGGVVLPGFSLPLRTLFDRFNRGST